jgi:hypothetical protein
METKGQSQHRWMGCCSVGGAHTCPKTEGLVLSAFRAIYILAESDNVEMDNNAFCVRHVHVRRWRSAWKSHMKDDRKLMQWRRGVRVSPLPGSAPG